MALALAGTSTVARPVAGSSTVSIDELFEEMELRGYMTCPMMQQMAAELRARRLDLKGFCGNVRKLLGAQALIDIVRGLQNDLPTRRVKRRVTENLKRLRLLALFAGFLCAAQRRAADRIYSPGAHGYLEAQSQFYHCAHMQRKRKRKTSQSPPIAEVKDLR